MTIYVKNKDTLIIDDFTIKCCVGKNGISSRKKEGDFCTPKGLFNLDKLYFRKDRVGNIKCKIKKKNITKNIAWCDDPKNAKYNQEIKTITKNHKENFYRKDNKYDYLISIDYNNKNVPNKGSAIFLHLTENYNPTAGCIAVKKKDFEIILKLIDQKTKIKIS